MLDIKFVRDNQEAVAEAMKNLSLIHISSPTTC